MPLKIYIDANIIIYFNEGEIARKIEVRGLLMDYLKRGDTLHSSEVVVGECLRGAWRHSPELVDTHLRLLSNSRFMKLEPVSLPLIKRGAKLGAELNMKLLDAIHIATAESLGCNIFLTNDRGIRTPAGIELRYLTAEL